MLYTVVSCSKIFVIRIPYSLNSSYDLACHLGVCDRYLVRGSFVIFLTLCNNVSYD